ncbi:hypothetical protein M431DRAFT_502138 [Trichoderma harzianum CBS 226.95]|uniref:Heterokaryon incompatibility domain-containing protein n=1 Tax=Trichoderma harzianum CBS 226.95 TaxID=983964 RepID=A0A2T4AS96_TRIHA|nr:hypothetical protein M431DRAFT_502138 [Trichoderma harzianum CBS 226.95]PTB59947.1 hypothetical protein M431DRAFT_502138 [Trichoderma harzianum CBS 226.95]
MDRPEEELSSRLQPLQTALNVCIQQHQGKCDRQRHTLLPTTAEPSQGIQEPRGIKVIDIKEEKVIKALPGCRYIALSYVWEPLPAGQKPDEYKEDSPLNLSRLPRTILDALDVCRALDERYLWVDALCINQKDERDELQIGQMDRIYSFAVATIVAACDKEATEGLPGLRSRSSVRSEPPPVDILDGTLWSSRGWTYQEFVLSRRLLLFTSAGIYFHCAGSKNHTLNGWELPSIGFATCWRAYNETLAIYSGRRLGRKSDTLNAITGVHRVFARYTDDTYLCGLPARQIFYALLWQPLAVSERQPSWPSWSWAGWTGSGDDLCVVGNPCQEAVTDQWGDSPARWGSTGRVFIPRLENLRFQASNGMELDIPLFPDDEALKQYLSSQHDKALPALAEDRPFWESGYLRFKATSKQFSITPDVSNPGVSKDHPRLKRCRILDGDRWIGTIFLNPDGGGNYPDISGPCEFVVLTTFKAYNHKIASSFLEGLLDMSVEDKEPAIFPEEYYQAGRAQQERQFRMWMAGKFHSKKGYMTRGGSNWGRTWESERDPHRGMPYPAHFDCSHVMWIERKGDVAYRKAIGIVGGDHSHGSSLEEFCLG